MDAYRKYANSKITNDECVLQTKIKTNERYKE